MTATMENTSTSVCIAGWRLDPQAGRLSRGEETVKLEPKVMEVLLFLARRPGEVVTREQIETEVWNGVIVGYDSLSRAMLKIRKAFNDDPRQPRIIETISKRGYRLVASVEQIVEPVTDEQPAPVEHEPLSSPTTPSPHKRNMIPDESRSGRPSPQAIPLAWRQVWNGTRIVLARKPVMLLAVFILTVTVLAVFHELRSPDIPQPSMAGNRVSIAVIPFDSLNDDAEQNYFVDGITDDLITDLTRISSLHVISRDSTFMYRNESKNIQSIAAELQVRYILHGSVRRAGNRIRINAQLTDTTNMATVWAQRFDGELKNVFDLQDEIGKKIVTALSVKLTTEESHRLARRDTENLRAYEYFLQGEEFFFRYAKKSNETARKLMQKAIELDPRFARAHAMLGWTHTFDFMNAWSENPAQSLELGEKHATVAIGIREALPLAYFVRGLVYRERGEYVKALVEAEKAITFDPNYANGHVLTATLLYYSGRPREGLERMKKAIRLNPHHPYNYPFHLGQAYFVLERYQDAIEAFNRGISSNPAAERLHVWLAAAYAQAGKIDDAKWEIDQVLLTNAALTVEKQRKAFPFKDPRDLERFLGALRKAGMPVN